MLILLADPPQKQALSPWWCLWVFIECIIPHEAESCFSHFTRVLAWRHLNINKEVLSLRHLLATGSKPFVTIIWFTWKFHGVVYTWYTWTICIISECFLAPRSGHRKWHWTVQRPKHIKIHSCVDQAMSRNKAASMRGCKSSLNTACSI